MADVLNDKSLRESGKQAQRLNIAAAKLVGEMVRTTLGPKGMDKMLVAQDGGITVTNDGLTILKEMSIDHPAARMIVEVARTQEDEVGDGTTTAVVLAAELLRQAEALLDQDIHPTVIARGYRQAGEFCLAHLSQNAKEIRGDALLESIAETAMTGKGAEQDKAHLSSLVMKAVRVLIKDGIFERQSIRLHTRPGAAVGESKLIDGIILDKERPSEEMPRIVNAAKIALLNMPLEVKGTELDTKIQIDDAAKFQSFIDLEERMLDNMIEKLAGLGANVIICQKGIDDMAQHRLAAKGILALRRVKKSDMDAISKATGARMMMSLDELNPDWLGQAGKVEESVITEDERIVMISGCQSPQILTLLIRGGTRHIVDEIERALQDAIGDIAAALRNKRVLPGAGAPEMMLYKALDKHAQQLLGREQLAAKAFAKALLVIPRTLAENAGLDSIDMMTALTTSTDSDAGIDVFKGDVIDAWKRGVIEPLSIKTQAISSATEVAIMILRIDDVILGDKGDAK